jgi:hypothetical protein
MQHTLYNKKIFCQGGVWIFHKILKIFSFFCGKEAEGTLVVASRLAAKQPRQGNPRKESSPGRSQPPCSRSLFPAAARPAPSRLAAASLFPIPCSLPPPGPLPAALRRLPYSLFPIHYSLFPLPSSPPPGPLPRPAPSRLAAASLFPIPCSLFPIPCSLFPIHCSLFPVHCSLRPPSSTQRYCPPGA